jgi:hypothetical protein
MLKLDAWWVVYKVKPHEQLYTPTKDSYHFDDKHVDQIYREKELSNSFVVEPSAALDSLVGDNADVTIP